MGICVIDDGSEDFVIEYYHYFVIGENSDSNWFLSVAYKEEQALGIQKVQWQRASLCAITVMKNFILTEAQRQCLVTRRQRQTSCV